jgi:Tfp pilus assembly PilM family ATPase
VRSHARTLPLGIDIGRRRVRIALMERSPEGYPRLMAVATREYLDDPSGAIAAAHAELQTKETRCVLALARPDAMLNLAEFPPMPDRELRRAARFEAARFVDYPLSEATVTLVRTATAQRWIVGTVRRAVLAANLRAARKARLRPLAVDDASFAFRRAYPEADAIVDVGEEATRLMLYGPHLPFVNHFAVGGAHFTEAIADGLGLDPSAAEDRKRNVGFGGVATYRRDEVIAWLAGAVADSRRNGASETRTIVVCGNGSRIAGFAELLHGASGCDVRRAQIPPDASDAIPPDVLRAAAPDWSLAFGLALWSRRS